ncbi:hypothetical protein [Virgisporangium aurantiacum]|uniref:Uncharacterized protein n=1 Tax=Virgisporangium aurantiacum TaxID=175570 RepID=A0A8J3ZII7_9ACTN|nr:hypothetical protein [Virgisporangium aurantiacum]GIJ64742.1 hypothetical protein Vau01_122580 [Virgisporangium aurantiacum]
MAPLPMWDWVVNEVGQRPAIGGAALVVLLATLGFGYRLLAEAQRRATLDRVLTRSPGGSVIMQQKGLGGPAIWIWVGSAPPAVTDRGEYTIVVLSPPGPAQPEALGGWSSREM